MSSEVRTSFQALQRLLRYAAEFRPRIFLATICSVLNKLFDIMPEILIGMAIDVVVREEGSFLGEYFGLTDPKTQMLLLGGLTLAIWIFESVFEYLYLVLWRNLAQDLQHSMRLEAYRHVQHLDLAYFEDSSTGNLVSILNDDVNQLERFFNGGANNLIQVATTVVAVGGVFFFLSPLIALLAFSPIPIVILGAFWFQRRAMPLYAEVRERVGVLASRLSANISGIATIKSFATEKLEAERVRKDSEVYVEANRRAIIVSSAFIPVIRIAILAGFLATLLVGGWMTFEGALLVSSYSLLVFLTQRLLWPLTNLAETVDLFERAMASSRRILDLIEVPIAIRDRPDAIALTSVEGRIAFRHVDFAYANGPLVLRDIDLEIEPTRTVAFVGHTGSGKSSLIKLLLRFYEPQRGEVLLDGVPLPRLRTDDIRRQIGLVSQDVFLFQGTIRENIAYGVPDASEAAILEAARAAEAMEFIEMLPEGLDTVVGERGQKLSGGQRQRLSLARALLKDPAILILDEATSSVDNETEAAIQRSLAKISHSRTTLVIAHRLSTIVHADRIFVIDGGRIVESGTHAELLARGGIYSGLWAVQTGQEIVVGPRPVSVRGGHT